MSDTPGPWRRIDGDHYQRCGEYGANVYRLGPRLYRWRVYGSEPHPPFWLQPLEHGAAPTLAAAKHAATAALATLAADGRWNMEV